MNIKQRKIIKSLIVDVGQRYSQLAKLFNTEDKFSYHIKYLLQRELVEKREDLYFVTLQGRNTISEFDWDSLETIKQRPLVCIGFIIKEDNHYLLHQKSASPFKAWYRLPGFPVNEGTNFEETAAHYLQISSKKFKMLTHSTHHRRFFNQKGEFLWSSVLLVFTLKLSVNIFKSLAEDKDRWKWFNKRQIKSIKRWREVDTCIFNKINKHFYQYTVWEKE